LDAGSNPDILTTDQRGAGFPRNLGGLTDMGATETVDLVVRNTNDSGPHSLRQTILDANAVLGANTITFEPTYFSTPRVIALTTGELAISDTLTINGPGATLTTVSGTNASRIFNTGSAPTGTSVDISGLTLASGKSSGAGGAIYVGDEALNLT